MSLQATCPAFDPKQETISEFLERFKVQASEFIAKAGDDNLKKAAVLIKALPVHVITDLQRRIKPIKLSEATYTELEGKLTAQFVVKKSVVGASVRFLNRKQGNESIEQYARILNDAANDCNYKDCCRDRLLRDSFISGLKSSAIVGGLLQDCESKETISFNECVTKAKLLEQISIEATDLGNGTNSTSMTVHKVFPNKNKKPPKNYVCIRCLAKESHYQNNCPAIGKQCSGCKGMGHYVKACKSKNKSHAVVEEDENAGVASPATNQQPASGGVSDGTANHLSGKRRSQASASTYGQQEQTLDDKFYHFLG